MADAATEFLAAGPLGVLQAVAGTGEVVGLLQRHFHVAVQPRLAVVCLFKFVGFLRCEVYFFSLCSDHE